MSLEVPLNHLEVLATVAGEGDDDPTHVSALVAQLNVAEDPLEELTGQGRICTPDVVEYVRECDDSGMEVDVCADQELCEEQLSAIVEPLRSCDEQHGYQIEIPDGC